MTRPSSTALARPPEPSAEPAPTRALALPARPAPAAQITSWGRTLRSDHGTHPLFWRGEALPAGEGTLLPYGLGRSYGDSCLNPGGELLLTRGLDRFIAFDRETGVLRCESGVSLAEILQLVVPQGWFLPVTPGTKFVTVGGAIANDVHGKNHHASGTFGRWVRRFELLRSDGQRLECAPTENADWFGATIGGLGLTGLITWAEIQLRPIANPWVRQETVKFHSLDEFFQLSAESEKEFEYTVSWVDCLRKETRGHFIRGNNAEAGAEGPRAPGLRLRFPVEAPGWALNPATVGLFNFAYFHRQIPQRKKALVHYEPFFYPLDGITDWNRMYGRKGFFQYQCVIPFAEGKEAVRELFRLIQQSRQGSFLVVLKVFGDLASPGWLSFPRPGVTLALDFPNRGEATAQLFHKLDALVAEAGGALYPAKDATMSAAHFQQAYPAWQKLAGYVDPRFSSAFWRRVTQTTSSQAKSIEGKR